MIKGIRFCFYLIFCFVLLLPLAAAPEGDILLQLRFYEGVRGPKPSEARVVTAYTLRPLFIGNFISEKSLLEEEAELKRVFNLTDLAVLAKAQWGWEPGRAEKRFQLVVLNGHEFLLQVVRQPQADTFRVQVIDQAAIEKTALLDSEIVLPAGKVSVFGFEDSLSQPFFLAVQRQSGAASVSESDLQAGPFMGTVRVPKLLKKVDPVFPEKLRASGATASITLQMDVDELGKVWRVKAFKGEDAFVKAAVDAVTQWRVEPLVVDGKAHPQTFTCSVSFLNSGVALDFSSQTPAPGFQAIWPTQGYVTSIYGKRHHPLTKKEEFHNGIDIAAKVGTPVVSIAAGIVSTSEFRKKEGNVITIDHGRGFSSSYFYLASRRVDKGAVVAQGEAIGTVGSFAGGTGPHLHFEIRVNGELRNPADFMSPTKNKAK